MQARQRARLFEFFSDSIGVDVEILSAPGYPGKAVSHIDLVIVVLSLVGLLLLAGWLARRQRESADYYLGGGRLPAWSLGLSLAANQVSAISLIGAPAFVALQEGGGLLWLQYELAVPLAAAALILWGVPVLRRAAGAEVYAAVEGRLGRGARRTLAGFFLVGRGLAAGVILYTSSLVVAACTGWSEALSLLVMAVVAMAYTALGGLVADVFSDVLQLGLLWGATAVATVMVGLHLARRGVFLTGLDRSRLVALDLGGHGVGDGVSYGFLPMLVGGFFLYLSYYGCDQTQAQRILAAADEGAARRALAIGAMVRFPLVLTYCLFGVMLMSLVASEPTFAAALEGLRPDALVPEFMVRYLPAGVLGAVVAGILAAALSSIDSAFNSLSAVTVEEFLHEKSRGLAWARAITLVWGVFATVAAFCFAAAGRAGTTTIELINLVGSVLYGPTLAVFILAWRSRRADGRSAVAGAFSGVAVNLALAFFAPGVSWLWWNVTGCLTTLAVGAVFGRNDSRVEHRTSPAGRPLALVLVMYSLAIVFVLFLLTLVVT